MNRERERKRKSECVTTQPGGERVGSQTNTRLWAKGWELLARESYWQNFAPLVGGQGAPLLPMP